MNGSHAASPGQCSTKQQSLSGYFNRIPSSNVSVRNGCPVGSDLLAPVNSQSTGPPSSSLMRPSTSTISSARVSCLTGTHAVRSVCTASHGPAQRPPNAVVPLRFMVSDHVGIHGPSLPDKQPTAAYPGNSVIHNVDEEDDGFLAAMDAYEASVAPSTAVSVRETAVNAPDNVVREDPFDDVDFDFEELDKIEKQATQNQPTRSLVAPIRTTSDRHHLSGPLRPQMIPQPLRFPPAIPPRPRLPLNPPVASANPVPQILEDLPPSTQVPVNVANIPGFDVEAGLKWIYPTNYDIRSYQYNIVQKALFRNTMVCLPTGMGKTFIAAVVMYNFYRWYPEGRVMFMAPTRPLVDQQMQACYRVMGIPQDEMVELTGHTPQAKRADLWASKRVVFLTPQVAVNDLDKDVYKATDVKCLVIDEAHKASGNHHYVQLVRILAESNGQFRILALSATPGNDRMSIQTVLTNLRINHIEIRQEDSLDIMQYTHRKNVEKIVIPLGDELKKLLDRLMSVIIPLVNKLKQYGGIPKENDPRNLCQFSVLQLQRTFRLMQHTNLSEFVKRDASFCFFQLITLYHAYELMMTYGIRAFYCSIHDTIRPAEKGQKERNFAGVLLSKNPELQRLLEDVRLHLGIDIAANQSMRSFHEDASKPYVYGHPKLQKLEELVVSHFAAPSNAPDQPGPSKPRQCDSRVIVFTSYRDSVHEIVRLLRRHHPVVNPSPFIGQADSASKKGLNQREQLAVMQKFRSGDFNVLVSTCVGEEGLDIGEVDLIICFDSQKSAIRNVQRTGRTGRKREGKTVFLLAEGKEENKYRSCQSSKSIIQKTLTNFSGFQLYKNVARMVPVGLNPVCVKLQWTVPEFSPEQGRRSRTNGSKRTRKESNRNLEDKSAKGRRKYLTDEEYAEWKRDCRVPQDEVPGISQKRFLYDSSTFAEFCEKLRQRTVSIADLDKPLVDLGANSLSQHLRHAEIFNSFLTISPKTENFVTSLRRISDYATDFDADAYDPTTGKQYEAAVLAGYIEVSDTELLSDNESIPDNGKVSKGKSHQKVRQPSVRKQQKAETKKPTRPDPFASESDDDVEKAEKHRKRIADAVAAHGRSDMDLVKFGKRVGLRTALQRRLDHLSQDLTAAPVETVKKNEAERSTTKLLDDMDHRKTRKRRLETLDTPPATAVERREQSPEIPMDTSRSLREIDHQSAETAERVVTGRESVTAVVDSEGSSTSQSQITPNRSSAATGNSSSKGLSTSECTQENVLEGSADKTLVDGPVDGALEQGNGIDGPPVSEPLPAAAPSGLDAQHPLPSVNLDILTNPCDLDVDIAEWEPWNEMRPNPDRSMFGEEEKRPTRPLKFDGTYVDSVEPSRVDSSQCQDLWSFNTALQYVNQTSVIPDSPSTKQNETRPCEDVDYPVRLDFNKCETDLVEHGKTGPELVVREASLPTVDRPRKGTSILASNTFIPLSRGPSSHSTPMLYRSRKRVLSSPNLSPVRESMVGNASSSRIPASFISEKEEDPDVIMASFSEDESDNEREPVDAAKDVIPSSLPYDSCTQPPSEPIDEKVNQPQTAPATTNAVDAIPLKRNPAGHLDCPIETQSQKHIPDENRGSVRNGTSKSRDECVISVDSPVNAARTMKTPPLVLRHKKRSRISFPSCSKDASGASALKQHNKNADMPGRSSVATNNDDDEEIVFRGRRRFRPLDVFDTPSPGRKTPATKLDTAPVSKRNPKPRRLIPEDTKRLKQAGRQFLCTQADCSDECSADEAEEHEPDGEYPASFVDSGTDETNPSYMQAIYARGMIETPDRDGILHQIRSRKFREDVFSQPFQQDPDYGSDSFVAYSDEETSPAAAKKTKAKRRPVAKAWHHDFGKSSPRSRRKK